MHANFPPDQMARIVVAKENLEPIDISNFASCSRDSEEFVNENRKYLPLYEFAVLDICYDPVTDAACLRAINGSRYSQSLVIDAKTIGRYIPCLRVQCSVSLVIGNFSLSCVENQLFSVFNHLNFQELASVNLSVPALKRATEFMFELDNIVQILIPRSWTTCEKFKIDTLVLFFHEQLYKQKAKTDLQSALRRLSNRFSKTTNEKMAFFCRKGRTDLNDRHFCGRCSEANMTTVTFPTFSQLKTSENF